MFQNGPRGPAAHPRPAPPRPAPTPAVRQLVNPVTPYHAPAPAPHSFVGSIGGAIRHAAPAVHNAVQQATTPHQAGAGPHNAFTRTPQYKQAVAQVFHEQPPAAKAAIIRGISRANAFNTPEYQAIRPQWDHLSLSDRSTISSLIPKDLPKFIAPKPGPDIFGDLGRGLMSGAHTLEGLAGVNWQQHLQTPGATPAEKALAGLGAGAAKLIDKIPTGIGMPTEQRGILKQQGLVPGELGKNLLKDAVNLPAEALPSVAIPVGEAAQGHWSQALHAVTDPYVQALKNPQQAIAQHPLNTFLMFSGPTHLGARVLDTGASLAVKHQLPNVKAESVHLTGNLTHERPDFSKSPITRLSQKNVEKQLYKRNRHGKLVPRSDAVRARLIKLETSRLVGQNERVRVARREQQVNAHAKTVLQPKAARALHSVRTAAKYNPEPALIPGANVLARIADRTIRRPDTVARDLKTHLEQVAANRPNLAGRPKLLASHDAYVKELQSALNNKAFLRNPAPAFKAAERYAKDYAPIQAAAHALGHFRDMTKSALQRRELAHYAITHMGARQDPELGLVDAAGHPLSNQAIIAHLNGPNGTGGWMPAFTSDQPRAGDKAFFVNGQRRPPVAAKGNTYFAYTHGLTAPGHEAMLEQRVRMQGIVDAHSSMNRLADQLLLQNERTGKAKAWGSYKAAQADAPEGYVPIRLAQPFHPQDSLAKAFAAGKVDMATLEEEAAHRQLDINSRLQPSSEPGTYGLIDQHAATQLRAHENLISPNTFYRGLRGLTGQFRRVALATSFRHLPGVAQEEAIRAAAEGIGPISLLAGHAALRRAEQINPKLGEQRRIEMTGGTASGQALALQTRQVAHHFAGTMLEGPLTAFEKLTAAPGARQVTHAWRAWVKFTLGGTKHVLEQNAQISAIGKQVIADFGGRHGLLAAAMGNWGKMIDQAGHGILDEKTARQMGAYVRRVYGRWTDLTPGEQAALMFSPFGMWWTNSVAWLARMPVDHPMGSAFMAALNSGTEQQRKALGLDMFAPNHLPLYQQGSIPVGGKLWGANYYSAFGVANDPGETAQSLIAPWQSELLKAFAGQDWKGTTITSPANPAGRNKPPAADVGVVILNSLLSSFVPLYTKAQTIVQGGASSYDTSTAFAPKTKKANPGPVEGLKKATMPLRLSAPAGSSTGASSSGGWGGATSSSSSSGWGGSTSSGSSSGGWGG